MAWVLLGYGLIVGLSGPILLDLPEWTTELSAYEHMSPVPVEPFTAGLAPRFLAAVGGARSL